MTLNPFTRRATVVLQAGFFGASVGACFTLVTGHLVYLWALLVAGVLFGSALPLSEDS